MKTGNNIGNKGVQILSQLIVESKTLQKLNVGCKSLVSSNKWLMLVTVCCNSVFDWCDGSKSFAEPSRCRCSSPRTESVWFAFVSTKHQERCMFSHGDEFAGNALHDDGVLSICSALVNNRFLRVLVLDGEYLVFWNKWFCVEIMFLL